MFQTEEELLENFCLKNNDSVLDLNERAVRETEGRVANDSTLFKCGGWCTA